MLFYAIIFCCRLFQVVACLFNRLQNPKPYSEQGMRQRVGACSNLNKTYTSKLFNIVSGYHGLLQAVSG
jgi:hypothetical protein